MKKTILIVLIIIALVGCSPKITESNQIVVASTFYPLLDLTRNIVGEKGIVNSIVPSGIEPHDYEPTPRDVQKLNSADAFVIIGIEFEQFESSLINSVNPSIQIIPASTGIALLPSTDDHEEDESGNDPHIWLSPNNAQVMTTNIMTGLIAADPDSAENYKKNGMALIEQLKLLDAEFKEGLAECRKRIVLVNHNAFAYLAMDYEFDVISISGLEPEAEPTPQQLAELVDRARENDIKYVFYEKLVDPKVARTIAKEVNAETLELNPLEGSSDPSDNYLSLMRQNLENLRKAMECQ
ncbi:zinc ABC transporter substrate-binding protein [Candidatus Woesearchaeota archaeon]|nr:zinc ABC transporter substrate-binding protein [Candidatus Woesearchaeota archaeon]